MSDEDLVRKMQRETLEEWNGKHRESYGFHINPWTFSFITLVLGYVIGRLRG